ncbi:unnamed protein product [Durusdinium trenchii]
MLRVRVPKGTSSSGGGAFTELAPGAWRRLRPDAETSVSVRCAVPHCAASGPVDFRCHVELTPRMPQSAERRIDLGGEELKGSKLPNIYLELMPLRLHCQLTLAALRMDMGAVDEAGQLLQDAELCMTRCVEKVPWQHVQFCMLKLRWRRLKYRMGTMVPSAPLDAPNCILFLERAKPPQIVSLSEWVWRLSEEVEFLQVARLALKEGGHDVRQLLELFDEALEELLRTEIKRWPAADDVLVNIAPFPAGAPAPVNGTSRLMFTLLLAEPEGALPPALRARLVAHCVNPRVPSMKALSAHEDVFGEFKKYAVMAQGIGLNPELSAKIIVWHEDSKTKSEDRFGPGDQVILTNEEATQALPSLGQIVVNLSISSAFPACKALAGKTGAHTTRPYHTCVGLTPDTNWIERFSLVLEPVDRDAAEALRLALRNLPVPAGKAPPDVDAGLRLYRDEFTQDEQIEWERVESDRRSSWKRRAFDACGAWEMTFDDKGLPTAILLSDPVWISELREKERKPLFQRIYPFFACGDDPDLFWHGFYFEVLASQKQRAVHLPRTSANAGTVAAPGFSAMARNRKALLFEPPQAVHSAGRRVVFWFVGLRDGSNTMEKGFEEMENIKRSVFFDTTSHWRSNFGSRGNAEGGVQQRRRRVFKTAARVVSKIPKAKSKKGADGKHAKKGAQKTMQKKNATLHAQLTESRTQVLEFVAISTRSEKGNRMICQSMQACLEKDKVATWPEGLVIGRDCAPCSGEDEGAERVQCMRTDQSIVLPSQCSSLRAYFLHKYHADTDHGMRF